MKVNSVKQYVFVALLLALLYGFYSYRYDYPFGRTFSLALAYGSVILIGLSLGLGLISVFLKRDFSGYRKFFGLTGFGSAFLHVLLSFRYSVGLSFLFGLLALTTFGIAASTSNDWAFKRLGFQRWRSIQRLSYIAFLLAMLHFVFIPNFAFIKELHGQILLVFSIFVVLAKIVGILVKK